MLNGNAIGDRNALCDIETAKSAISLSVLTNAEKPMAADSTKLEPGKSTTVQLEADSQRRQVKDRRKLAP